MSSTISPILAVQSLDYYQFERQYPVVKRYGGLSDDHRDSKESTSPSPIQSAVSTSNVRLFSSLSPSYDPSTHWLDGSSPSHPQFDDAPRMRSIVADIKDNILAFALEACRLVLNSVAPSDEPNHGLLSETLSQNANIWRGALLAQHYGVIYFMSRTDALSTYQPLMIQNPTVVDAIDAFLRSHNASGTRIINYAVHAYITRGGLRVDHSTSCVPPNAISAVGPCHVVVRAVDFFGRSASDVLATSSPMWDLHDFAHLSCATLCQELFGNKYQTNLLRLPKPLTALVRSPGMRTATGPKISDGLVFSELMTKMFTDAVVEDAKNTQQQTYKDITQKLASTLAEYYLGKCSLEHASTGQLLTLPAPISPIQLAVMVQNKSYELPASEIEQRVFTRGGPVCAKEDPMLGLTARERTAWLAENRTWGYFEVRNTIKHRAHKEAYRMVCEVLREKTKTEEERALLDRVRANILYEDWERGERVILWDLL